MQNKDLTPGPVQLFNYLVSTNVHRRFWGAGVQVRKKGHPSHKYDKKYIK